DEMLTNHEVQTIAVPGETGTGKRIMEGCAKYIKRLTLELGGSDPMIVCDDADLELAVEGAAWGRFRNCGQSCTSVKRLFLFEKIASEFTERLVRKVKTIRLGPGLDPKTHMGPLHNAEQREKGESMVEDATERGAKSLTGGRRPKGEELQRGYFYEPALLAGVE